MARLAALTGEPALLHAHAHRQLGVQRHSARINRMAAAAAGKRSRRSPEENRTLAIDIGAAHRRPRPASAY